MPEIPEMDSDMLVPVSGKMMEMNDGDTCRIITHHKSGSCPHRIRPHRMLWSKVTTSPLHVSNFGMSIHYSECDVRDCPFVTSNTSHMSSTSKRLMKLQFRDTLLAYIDTKHAVVHCTERHETVYLLVTCAR